MLAEMNTEESALQPKRVRAKVVSAKGGRARAAALTPEARRRIAKAGAVARWSKSAAEVKPPEGPPVAVLRGALTIMDLEIPCYVLDDGSRVIGRTSATEVLTGIKGGGDLEKYLGVSALRPFIPLDPLLEGMKAFQLPEVEGLDKQAKGLPTDLFIELCQGFVRALDAQATLEEGASRMTGRQIQMAVKASMFLSACAKVGLDALVDEATGYQYERPEDALQFKLKVYLEDEMRKWEKTFPDELWAEFSRLTGWSGTNSQRPKYWGKLVNELVYESLDPDVARWLKENNPTPTHGRNYHQWLSSQFGLKKLVERIWTVIGMSRACTTLMELRDKNAAMNGKVPFQMRFYMPPPKAGGSK
jgi:hypothetical protein